MNNNFAPQAVEIVRQAIEADNAQDYNKAVSLYNHAIEYFIKAIKYEQNPTTKKILKEKVDEYLSRAEILKQILKDGNSNSGGGGNAGATLSADSKKKKDSKDDDEKSKLRGALSSAIVSEKPNVKWDDVAGLEGAKEALKEGQFDDRELNSFIDVDVP